MRWLHAQFGFPSTPSDVDGDIATKSVLGYCRDAEGYASTGLSNVATVLLAKGSRVVSAADLTKYDANIRRHLSEINAKRSEPIVLKYFQHVALLYTEHLLALLANSPQELCAQINAFVSSTKLSAARNFPAVTVASLRKLGLMMATGSGKTLLLHIQYKQFVHYNAGKPISNVLLVTPNKDLSIQHEKELLLSGISCRRFDPERSRSWIENPLAVEIIEISRFVTEKKDKGSRVEASEFSGRNLVFVDEGHRSKGEEGVQRQIRDDLVGETGFAFEYSATFQQAFAADDDDSAARRDEYGAAIIFDYSYRWFLNDGFGKDFTVLNSRGEGTGAETAPLLAGLFVFAAQVHSFAAAGQELTPYKIAPPLALMVGSQVIGASAQDAKTKSDVLRVLKFFHRFLRNDAGWSAARLNDLLSATSELDTAGVGDAMKPAREYFHRVGITHGTTLFDFITDKILHSLGGGGLILHKIRGNENEIALRGSEAAGSQPFGLVYIGKASGLLSLVTDDLGIEISEDVLSDAWFPTIDHTQSPVNFLIGAKMFIEGWSSWRVSAMGLVNIGKSEGSEIIQLFGRGVRLRGLNTGLKRSTHIPGVHPTYMPLLERLFIFSVNSHYLETFRQTLEREGVSGTGYKEYQLRLWRQLERPTMPTLEIPTWPEESRFRDAVTVGLDISVLGNDLAKRRVAIRRDNFFSLSASDFRGRVNAADAHVEIPLSKCRWAPLLDFGYLYLELVRFARERAYHNLAFTQGDVTNLLRSNANEFIISAPSQFHNPETWRETKRFQEAVLDGLKTLTDRIYRHAQKKWESRNVTIDRLRPEHPNCAFSYKLRMPLDLAVKAPAFVADLEALVNSCPIEHWNGSECLAAVVNFPEHLYQPLLIDAGLTQNAAQPYRAEQVEIEVNPVRLNQSEQKFVDLLTTYWATNKNVAHVGERLFLLRNLSRGHGVGFFESEGFYPDFILWQVLADGRQRLVFIEPHGMRQDDAPDVDAKVAIAKAISEHMGEAIRAEGCSVSAVAAFILSSTPFEELRRKHGQSWSVDRYGDYNILFPEHIANLPGLGGLLVTQHLDNSKALATS